MANPGTIQTYDLPTGVKIDMENIIWLISPRDLPCQGGYGADGRSVLAVGEVFETKYDWMDEVLKTPLTTAAASASTTATVVTVASGTGINFQTGDVIATPEGEVINVTGYGTTVDTLIISRGYAGSSAAAMVTGDVLKGIGSALPEGSDPPAARARDRVDRNNYTEIFGPQAITVSGTEQAVKKYGLTGTEFDHQVGNALKEQGIAIEQAILEGVAYAGTGANGRVMGGMKSFILTNLDTTTTTLTDTHLLDGLQECYDAGGEPDRVMVGSKQKRVISGFQSGDIRIMSSDSSANRRGYKVDYFESDYGMVSVCLNRWMRVADLIAFERDQAEICTLRPLQFEMLAKTGDAEKGQVVGEKGFKFRMQTHAFRMNALT